LWVRAPPNPIWISQPRFSREAALGAVERPIRHLKSGRNRVNNAVKKRQKGQENLEKQQQTWRHEGQVAQGKQRAEHLMTDCFGSIQKERFQDDLYFDWSKVALKSAVLGSRGAFQARSSSR
jgi:hypothetical protein